MSLELSDFAIGQFPQPAPMGGGSKMYKSVNKHNATFFLCTPAGSLRENYICSVNLLYQSIWWRQFSWQLSSQHLGSCCWQDICFWGGRWLNRGRSQGRTDGCFGSAYVLLTSCFSYVTVIVFISVNWHCTTICTIHLIHVGQHFCCNFPVPFFLALTHTNDIPKS